MNEKGFLESIDSAINDSGASESMAADATAATILAAFKAGEGDLLVRSKGKVVNVLSDDTIGSRHQRFIVKLANNHTVLIAHNIDLAPRVENIKKGDEIVFSGEYEWNEKGGVIHWTHKDPNGKHSNGWLEHNGIVYE